MILLSAGILLSVIKIFLTSYEKQIKTKIDETSKSISLNTQSFVQGIYSLGKQISKNETVLTMD